ncbi:cysteine hydrolase family protein [Mariniphaga sediminis]|uniref:cysteine hydrolase family protein n=1 Tax=Mariniphaga sediminis TaxID=1628158 RepID=UPI003569AE8C
MTKKTRKFKKIILGIAGILVLFILIVIVNLIIFEKNASVVSKGQPIKKYGEHNYALLVIDIQEATTGETSMSSFYKTNSEVLIKNINQIVDSFKNRNSLVIYVRSEISNPFINLLNNSFAKGGLGSKFDKRLKSNYDFEIVKSRNDAFNKTKLDNILATNKINELYIVGLDAAYCIKITSEAARNRNYQVNIIEEAILSESETMKDSMLTYLKDWGIKILSIDSIKILEDENANAQQSINAMRTMF